MNAKQGIAWRYEISNLRHDFDDAVVMRAERDEAIFIEGQHHAPLRARDRACGYLAQDLHLVGARVLCVAQTPRIDFDNDLMGFRSHRLEYTTRPQHLS